MTSGSLTGAMLPARLSFWKERLLLSETNYLSYLKGKEMPGIVVSWLDANWFPLLVAVFILGMMLYGHTCGFLRLAVSFAALLITVILVRLTLPYAVQRVEADPQIRAVITQKVREAAGIEGLESVAIDTAEAQEQVIDSLELPESLRRALKQNNTEEIWERLGASRFQEYAVDYLSRAVLRTVLGILLFFAVSILLRILMHVLDIFTRLPVVHGLNQIFGAFLGLAWGLVLVWTGFLVLGFFERTVIGSGIRQIIDRVLWLKLLYDMNPVGMLLRGILLSAL